MDDTLASGRWSLDPQTCGKMRLKEVARAMQERRFQDAIHEAEELLHEEPKHAEALSFLAEASLEVGDVEVAVLAYEKHVRVTEGKDALSLLGLGTARLEICDLEGAANATRDAVNLQPDLAEAHYQLGLALEFLGQGTEALQSFAAARQLAPQAYPFPLELSDTVWQEAIVSGLRTLEPKYQLFWSDIPIHLEPSPDIEAFKKLIPPLSPLSAGLYVGDSQDEEAPLERPQGLRLFLSNLAKSPSLEHLIEHIAATLRHEADAWLDDAEENEDP